MEARAVVLASVVQNADLSYEYSYEIDNSAGTFDIFLFSLEFDFPVEDRDWNPVDILNGGEVLTPLQSAADPFDDWAAVEGVPITGEFAQDFFAVGPLGEGDVLVGESLGGFSFTSAFAPREVTFTAFSPGGASTTGLVVGPSSIPEPSIATFGLIAFVFLFRRKSRGHRRE